MKDINTLKIKDLTIANSTDYLLIEIERIKSLDIEEIYILNNTLSCSHGIGLVNIINSKFD